MRVRVRSEDRLIVAGDLALENKVELMLPRPVIGFFPIEISDMQQPRDRNVSADLFQTLPLQGLFQAFARFLFSAWQGEIVSFDRVLFYLNQQVLPAQDKRPRRGADERPEDLMIWI